MDETAPTREASFKNRLDIKGFMFTSTSSDPSGSALRRSPRLGSGSATPTSPGGAVVPAAIGPARLRGQSPQKRAMSSADGPEDETPSQRAAPAKRVRGAASPHFQSPNPRSKSKSSGYAPPSTYAHLPYLPDALGPNLLVMFVGLNPGLQTAATGHAYAHKSNLFWKLLYSSGVTPVACKAEEDRSMPERFELGLTNIVSRPSRNGAELKREELDAGVATLEEKARRWRPESVCIVGKSIWESIWRVRHGRAIGKAEFRYGWQDDSERMGVLRKEDRPDDVEKSVRVDPEWKGARVFVATSTSGLAATLSPAEKQAVWRQLGEWVEGRRKEKEASVLPKVEVEEEA